MKTLAAFLSGANRGSSLLGRVAWFHVALAVLFLVLVPFDTRLVTGINPWIKPFKFASSIALYTFTLAYLLGLLDDKRFAHRIAIGVSINMLLEIALISLQAARGVRSHFNQATALDGAIFGVMGAAITVNAVLDLLVARRFWKPQPKLAPSVLWGIRLGLLIFVAGSLEGFVMVRYLGHSVGAPDGGPGLPIVNWSTTGGDLRIAHFFALHALQALPLLGYGLVRWGGPMVKKRGATWVQVAGAAYVLVAAGLLGMALAGIPLLRG